MNDVIRKRDAQGRLTVSGYEWRSMHMAIYSAMGLCLAVGSYGAFGLVASLLGKSIIYEIWMPLLLLMSGVCSAYGIYRYGWLRNGIHFNAEGSIDAPYGLPWPHWRLRRLQARWSDVLSIETLRNPQSQVRHAVVMYKRDGDIIYLTNKDYSFEFAHKVARQLTLALDELKFPRTENRY